MYSIQVLADELFPGKGADIAVKWRDKQIEYTRLITQSDPHNPSGSQYFRPFWELTRLSLEYTLYRLKLDSESGQVEKLMQQYAHLTPFTESLAVLQKIKGTGFTTAILSNGSVDMLTSAVKSAGMEHVLVHLNNVVKLDHREIKRITRPMLRFKSFWSTRTIIAGIETTCMIKNGQMNCPVGKTMSAANQF